MSTLRKAAASRVARVHRNHKRIARGVLLTSMVAVAAKVCVAGREVAIAWRYGISGVVDSYQLAFMITTWLPVIVVAIASSVLIPRLVALRSEPTTRDPFVRDLNFAALAVGGLLSLAAFLAASPIVLSIGAGMDGDSQQLAIRFVRLFAPIGLLTVVGGYLAIRLQARETYAFGIAEGTPAITTVLFLVLSPPSMGATPLIFGVTLGAVAQVLVLLPMIRRADGGVGGYNVVPRSTVWPSLYGSFAFMALGQVVLSLSLPIDQAFASGLGEGALAQLGYANRLLGLATTLGAVVLTRSFLPVLSQVAAEGAHPLGRHQTLRWSWAMFGLGALLAAVGWWAAPWGVAVIFERGAFTPQDSESLALVVRFGLAQVPFFFAGMVCVQWLVATTRYDVLVYTAILGVGVKLGLNFALVPALGLPGIMLATASMYAVTFLSPYVLIRSLHARSGAIRP